jgi:hypothetical protein
VRAHAPVACFAEITIKAKQLKGFGEPFVNKPDVKTRPLAAASFTFASIPLQVAVIVDVIDRKKTGIAFGTFRALALTAVTRINFFSKRDSSTAHALVNVTAHFWTKKKSSACRILSLSPSLRPFRISVPPISYAFVDASTTLGAIPTFFEIKANKLRDRQILATLFADAIVDPICVFHAVVISRH